MVLSQMWLDGCCESVVPKGLPTADTQHHASAAAAFRGEGRPAVSSVWRCAGSRCNRSVCREQPRSSPRFILSREIVLMPSEPASSVHQQTSTTASQPPAPADAKEPEELLVTKRFRVVRVSEACRDGTQRVREIVEHPGSVVIMPLLEGNRICLIRNARRAVGATLWELPAGTLDREEPIIEAARRELEEETGYRAGVLEEAPKLWMSPGILRERMHVFVARNLTPGPQALEPGETIDTHVLAWEEAVAMCLDGTIEDAKTVAAILRLEVLRNRG